AAVVRMFLHGRITACQAIGSCLPFRDKQEDDRSGGDDGSEPITISAKVRSERCDLSTLELRLHRDAPTYAGTLVVASLESLDSGTHDNAGTTLAVFLLLRSTRKLSRDSTGC